MHDDDPGKTHMTSAHLLPTYDKYTIAYKDHSAILDPDYQELVVGAFGIVIVIVRRQDHELVQGGKL
jgi:hypothetical protein